MLVHLFLFFFAAGSASLQLSDFPDIQAYVEPLETNSRAWAAYSGIFSNSDVQTALWPTATGQAIELDSVQSAAEFAIYDEQPELRSVASSIFDQIMTIAVADGVWVTQVTPTPTAAPTDPAFQASDVPTAGSVSPTSTAQVPATSPNCQANQSCFNHGWSQSTGVTVAICVALVIMSFAVATVFIVKIYAIRRSHASESLEIPGARASHVDTSSIARPTGPSTMWRNSDHSPTHLRRHSVATISYEIPQIHLTSARNSNGSRTGFRLPRDRSQDSGGRSDVEMGTWTMLSNRTAEHPPSESVFMQPV